VNEGLPHDEVGGAIRVLGGKRGAVERGAQAVAVEAPCNRLNESGTKRHLSFGMDGYVLEHGRLPRCNR